MAQVPLEQCFVEPTSCAEEDTIPQFAQHRCAKAKPGALRERLSGAGVHSGTAIDVIGRNARVE